MRLLKYPLSMLLFLLPLTSIAYGSGGVSVFSGQLKKPTGYTVVWQANGALPELVDVCNRGSKDLNVKWHKYPGQTDQDFTVKAGKCYNADRDPRKTVTANQVLLQSEDDLAMFSLYFLY